MKNFQNFAIESVNDVKNLSGLYPNSLVLVNKSGTKAFNLRARVKNTQEKTIVRALLKTLLVVQAEVDEINATPAAKKTLRRFGNPLTVGLSGTQVWVANKDGVVIKQACDWSSAKGELTLRQAFRITKSNPLYQAVIVDGLSWDNAKVKEYLSDNVERTLELMGAKARIDAAIDKANGEEKTAKTTESKSEKKAA